MIALVSTAHEPGGAEVYLGALAYELGERVPLTLLAPPEAGKALGQLAAAGIATETVPGLARRPAPAALWRLARLLRRLKPRLVHVNVTDQGDGIVPILAARLARVPVVATLHLVLPGRRARLEALSRLTLRMPGRMIAVSEFVAGYLREAGIEPAVVRNGVAPAAQDPDARAALGAGPGDYVVGGIGRLDRQKGWDVLCAAAPLVRERVPQVRFVVIGDGPQRGELAELGRRAGVSFAGYRECAASLIGGFDVLAVPSRYEGFGLVAVEAMLAGVPVVASAADSLPEVVGDAGRVVPVDDPAALAEAIASLAEDRALSAELVQGGRRRAESLFGRGRMAEETLAVWSEAAGAALP